MKTKVNQLQRAYLGWIILTDLARNEGLITYKEFGGRLEIHHRAVRFVLKVIQEYCMDNNLAPITILVGDKGGIPGHGFIAWDIDDIDEGFRKVYGQNWEIVENPFVFAAEGITEDMLISKILDPSKGDGEDIFARVRIRGIAQQMFRRALLKAYGSKCGICGLNIKVALQAAHILPWRYANRKQRFDITNGILLCANHHCLYDNNLFIINEDYSVKSQVPISTGAIRLPSNPLHRPGTEYIKARKEIYKK